MGGGMGRGSGEGGRWGTNTRKPKDFKKAFAKSIRWGKPVWHILLFGLVCTLGGVFLGSQPPRIVQYTVDHVIAVNKFYLLWKVIAVYVGIVLLAQIISSVSGFWMNVAGMRILHALRMALYDQFQKLSLSYFDNNRVGDLTARVTGDVNQLQNMIVSTSNQLARQIFGVAIALYYMCTYNLHLALLVLIPVPFLLVGMILFTRRVRVIYRSIREGFGDMSAKLMENLSGIRVIKAFARESQERKTIEDISLHVYSENIRASKMSTKFYPGIRLMSSMGTVIVLGFGTYLISKGRFTVGEMMAFLMYVTNFYQPVTEFIRMFDSIQRALASGERIFEVLDAEPDIEDPETPALLPGLQGKVEFDHVCFRYATGEEVLHDINVVAEPGQRVALVGHSGAGKSSFINLIPRFYDATAGRILVDGVDVRDLRQSDLRGYTSMVLQETFLFNGTVMENLRFGNPSAGADEVIEAAKAANAHEFIQRLEEGYETQIGERGIKLSGGQKQRIAIARAVLADPRILILDEATSSVDSESEFLIHQALDRLMVGRTTFIIAHRLSTIRNADTILVLDSGNIVESGDHDTLVDADGKYAQMCRQQYWLDEEPDDDGISDPNVPDFQTTA